MGNNYVSYLVQLILSIIIIKLNYSICPVSETEVGQQENAAGEPAKISLNSFILSNMQLARWHFDY